MAYPSEQKKKIFELNRDAPSLYKVNMIATAYKVMLRFKAAHVRLRHVNGVDQRKKIRQNNSYIFERVFQ